MSNLTMYDTVAGPYTSEAISEAVIGPQLIGGLINLIFWGFAISQFSQYLYSPRFRVDSFLLKSTVYIVMFLATMQSTFHFWLIYHTIVSVDRSTSQIITQTVIGCLDLLPVGIEGAIVQTYLSIRASLLFSERRNRIIFLTICGIGITCGLFGALSFLSLAFIRRAGKLEELNLPLTIDISIGIFLYSCAGIDILVTSVLLIQIQKNIKGFTENTDGMLRHLMKLAVASASYTAIFATIPALLIVAIPKTSLSFNSAYLFPIPLSSFYALSLLHGLLSSSKIRTRGANDGYATKATQIQTWNGKNPKISIIPVDFNGRDDIELEESGKDFKSSLRSNGESLQPVRFC